MFTGIIEELGIIQNVENRPVGSRLRIRAKEILTDLEQGASIAVNGVCLTAVDIKSDSFGADVSPETMRRTNLGDLHMGSFCNLERAMSAGGRLGGHIVQGHVDGTGEFVAFESLGEENWWLKIRVKPDLERYIVEKGSIAIDGVSLTVAALDGDIVAVAVVPHTYRSTALRSRRAGDRVNVECDVLAKYVEKMVAAYRDKAQTLNMDRLRELGY